MVYETIKDIFMVENDDYKKEILDIMSSHDPGKYVFIKYHRQYLYDYIMSWSKDYNLKSFTERYYWAVNGMTVFPRCEYCGKPLSSKQFEHFSDGYRRHCSKKCAGCNPLSKQRVKEYNLKKYGYEHTAQVPSIKKKMVETNIKRYGTENVFASDYGKKKIKEFWNKNYGIDNPLQLQKIKDLQSSHREASKKKEYETKRKNHTFNTSKPEEKCFKMLCEKFGGEDVLRQYSDKERYPYQCDFYIKSRDIFIEYNGHWTHGKHPYDNSSEDDNRILNNWMEKSEHNAFYRVAIDVWTRRDVEKRVKAKESKINIVELWNIGDVERFVEEYSV